MNILLVNQNWFAAEFIELGHRVITFGRSELLDVKQEKLLVSWSEIKSALPVDFEPELLIIHDNSMPVLITELETIDIPSIFYSVDTHHHLQFHRYLGLIFTHLFVAQKDYVQEFNVFQTKPHWLPLWASIYMEPEKEKKFGAVFLGTLNPALNPDRVKFFAELQKLVEIDVRTASFASVFPASQIVVNQTVKGDLNFRVFEAMMSGALLITERSGNGLGDLFEDGKHLVLYTKGDAQDAADKISYYLNHPEEALEIATAGRNLVCEYHLPVHRAKYVLEQLSRPTRPVASPHCFAAIQNYGVLSATLNAAGDKLWATRAALEILRITQLGLKSKDRPDPILALDMMRALLSVESILSKEAIQNVLDDLRNAYPDMTLFHLVKIDYLAVSGKEELALELSASMYNIPPADVLKQASEIISELRR